MGKVTDVPTARRPVVRYSRETKSVMIDVWVPFTMNPTVKWLFNGRSLTDGDHYRFKEKPGVATLRIRNASDDDSGRYVCVICISSKGTTKEREVALQLILRNEPGPHVPRFVKEAKTEWLKGQKVPTIRMSCQVSSPSQPAANWELEGREVHESSRVVSAIQKIPTNCSTANTSSSSTTVSYSEYLITMDVASPTEEDVGSYSCMIMNGTGKATARFELEGCVDEGAVSLIGKPMVTEEWIDNEHTTLVRVFFRSIEKPQIKWIAPRNLEITDCPRTKLELIRDASNPEHYTASLRLRDYTIFDNGTFICQIRNNAVECAAIAEVSLNIES